MQVARVLAHRRAAGGSPAVWGPLIGGQNVRNNDALQLIVYLPLTPLRRVILHETGIFLCLFSFIWQNCWADDLARGLCPEQSFDYINLSLPYHIRSVSAPPSFHIFNPNSWNSFYLFIITLNDGCSDISVHWLIDSLFMVPPSVVSLAPLCLSRCVLFSVRLSSSVWTHWILLPSVTSLSYLSLSLTSSYPATCSL